MPDTTLTITIPGRVAPASIGALTERLEHAVQSVLGTACDITRDTVPLHRDDARVTGYGLLTAIRFHSIVGEAFSIPPLQHADRMRQLAHSLIGDGQALVEQQQPTSVRDAADAARAASPVALVVDELGSLSREQEAAADTMARRFGRSHVRPLPDGGVEIVGLTDDIERETVCIEQDGSERWRR